MPCAVKRDRELHRLAEIHRIDVQLDLDAVRVMVARLVQHHVPARHHEQAVLPLEEKPGGVGQGLLSEHRRHVGHGERQRLDHELPPQVEREREIRVALLGAHFDAPGVWPMREEAREAAALGLVGVDRKRLVSCGRRDATTWYWQPPSERSIQVSTRSNTSGACTPIVGCSAEGGCQAR